MKLHENIQVKFDELTHSYWCEGKELIGVTSLMKKHGLSPDYSNIDKETLKKAADLGTQAHQMIENYCEGLPTPETRLIKTFRDLGLNICHTEYLVSDNKIVASSIDLVNQLGKNEYELIDMKRTSTIHTEALEWQLGIYKYLFELANPTAKVTACYCLPIKKGNKDDIELDYCKDLVPITPQPAEEVIRLLQCEENGKIYSATPKESCPAALVDTIDSVDELRIVTAMEQIAIHEEAIKEYQDYINNIKEIILADMMQKNLTEAEYGNLILKVKGEYERASIDTTKLKKEKPDIYERYLKTTIVKPSLTIKMK